MFNWTQFDTELAIYALLYIPNVFSTAMLLHRALA